MSRRQNEFSRALSAAKHALAVKIRERDRATKLLRQLNVDIPNLERTVRALEAQLHGGGMADAAPRSGSGEPASTRVSRGAEGPVPIVGSSPTHATNGQGDEYQIPPDVLAQLPSDYLQPAPGDADDFLPEIEGKPVIPEK